MRPERREERQLDGNLQLLTHSVALCTRLVLRTGPRHECAWARTWTNGEV